MDAELSHPPAIDRETGRKCERQNESGHDEPEPRRAKEHGFFRESEIRGRLTDVLPFLPFSPREVEQAVRGFLASESKAFSQHPSFANVQLAWSAEAGGPRGPRGPRVRDRTELLFVFLCQGRESQGQGIRGVRPGGGSLLREPLPEEAR